MKNSILNLFGLGKLPFSASMASLIVLPVYVITFRYVSFPLLINCSLYALVLAWSLRELSRNRAYAETDPKEVVVDEFLGMHSCLLIAATVNLFSVAVLFVLFRIFDIFKLFPFNLVEKNIKGWYALLVDDIAIGISLGIVFELVNYFFKPGF